MEEIIKQLDGQLILLYTTFIGIIIFFLRDGSKLLFSFLTEVLKHWWHLKKEELTLEAKVRNSKVAAFSEMEIQRLKTETPLIKDVIYLSDTLKELRDYLNAFRITIYIFHNGTAKFFKNYSGRHQDCRNIVDRHLSNYQNKPLSTLYPIINYCVNQTITIFDENTEFEYIRHLILNSKTKINVIFLIMIDSEKIENSHNIISVKTNKGISIPLGFVSIELDEDSLMLTETVISYIKSFKQTIETSYTNSPEIFG